MNETQHDLSLEMVVETKNHLQLTGRVQRAIVDVGPTETPTVAIESTGTGGLRVFNYLYDWTYLMDAWQVNKLNPYRSIR